MDLLISHEESKRMDPLAGLRRDMEEQTDRRGGLEIGENCESR